MNEDFEPSQTPKAGKPGCLSAALSAFFIGLILCAGSYHNPGAALVTAFACLILVFPLPALFAVWRNVGLKDRYRYLAVALIFLLGSLMASLRTHELSPRVPQTRTVISSSFQWEAGADSGLPAADNAAGAAEKSETQPGSD